MDRGPGSAPSENGVNEHLIFELLESVPGVAIQGYYMDGSVFFWDQASEQLYGYTRDEALASNLLDLIIPPEMQDAVRDQMARAEIPEPRVLHLQRKDGQRVTVYSAHTAIPYGGQQPRMLCMDVDLTERERAQEQIARLGYAVEQSPSLVVITDTDLRIEYVNQRFQAVTGYTQEELVGQSPGIMRYDAHNIDLYSEIGQELAAGRIWEGQFKNRKRNGDPYWEKARISPISNSHGEVTHYIKMAEDISEQKALHERLEFLAFHDPLTGLPNRALIFNRIQQAVAESERSGRTVAVIFLDLDGFKDINDSLGHEQGDALLIQLARRLEGQLRNSDTLARFGGDEFLLMLKDLDDTWTTVPVLERLQRVCAEPVQLAESRIVPACSIGVAVAPDDSQDAADLIRCADLAMYRSKERGKRCYHFYTRQLDDQLQGQLELEDALQKALSEESLFLHFQPRVDLGTGAVESLEALIRWQHPSWGWLPPDQFIPVAEQSGLIHEIGRLVLRLACRQIQAWRRQGDTPLPIAINLSANEFQHPELYDRIMETLRAYDVEPHMLEIEITESAAMHSVAQTVDILRRLSDAGLRVSIDDFGTAYSSLNHLKRLPLHALKIDRTFIQGLGDDPQAHYEDATITQAIIAMSRTFGLEVIAEGIERQAQADFLLAQGCRLGQGFLLGRPQPGDQLPPGAACAAPCTPTPPR